MENNFDLALVSGYIKNLTTYRPAASPNASSITFTQHKRILFTITYT